VTERPTAVSDRRRPAPPEAGFALFYADRFAEAARLALLLTGDASVAEDLAQDAFARVRPRFDGLDRPWPYLRAAVVNACRSHHRGRARELARARRVGVPDDPVLGADELLDAVGRLPYRLRAVVVLRYYEDLSEREIADALGVRPGTVKSLSSRALARLATEVPR
jgi:RNA polymerase sigma factor (sigma-70 family)